jgi:hypothetical protein
MFQVSGNPGRHQWLQSLPWSLVYTEGCASFLNSERSVMSSKYTCFFMFLNTLFTTSVAGGRAAGYVGPSNGSTSPLHVFLGSFHSAPLY